jgi:hypothetical protein
MLSLIEAALLASGGLNRRAANKTSDKEVNLFVDNMSNIEVESYI